MNIIEEIRKEIILSLPIDKKTKNAWKSVYGPLLGSDPTSADILNLALYLSDIFYSTKKKNNSRSQKAVSEAGNRWESLIIWYINLCCTGSRVLAFRGTKLLPEIIKKSVSVTYGTLPCTAEPDVTVLIFPDSPIYTKEEELTHFLNKKNKIDNQLLNTEVTRDFNQMEVGVIQCKTNWNENAQIPMLWDIIYRTPLGNLQGIKVGTPPYSIQYIPFTYSFVTVPTISNLEKITPTSVCVARVKNLSGGNYWGMKSKSGVALSLDFIFQANFSNGFECGNINLNLNKSIPFMKARKQYNYFFK